MTEKSSQSKDATKKMTPAKKTTSSSKQVTDKKVTPKKPTQKAVEKSTTNKTPKKKKTPKKRGTIASIFHGIFSVTGNIFLLIVLLVLVGGAFACDYLLDIIYEIPPIDPTTIEDGLTENSIIVDENGVLLETLYDGSAGMRSIIEYKDIGQNMVNAITAIEDKTFFDHTGFNYVRLVGAALESITSGDDARGTSSITQQLAKNMYLTGEQVLERKIKEAYYAILLERTLTKEQILEAYLNKIALGMNANGVQSAANLYFSKDAKDLNLIESVILAGIPKSPKNYAPITRLPKSLVTEDHMIINDSDPQYTLVFNTNSQGRFDFVLKQMYENDMITEEEYALKGTDISQYLNPTIDQSNYISSYFGDLVKDDAVQALAEALNKTEAEAEKLLYTRGYKIYSTIDFSMQEKLENIYDATYYTESFDGAAYAGVRKFQLENGLTVDGIAGQNTLSELANQTSYTIDNFTLSHYKQGTTHEDVIILKKALDELGLLTSDGLFPRATVMFNNDGNILNDVSKKVVLWKFSNIINEDGMLIIKNENYYYDENDNLVLLKNKGLNFYQQSDRVQVDIDNLFSYDEGSEEAVTIDRERFHNISGLYMYDPKDVMIPDEYKSKVDGNLVIDKDIFKSHPDFFIESENGDLLVSPDNFYEAERGVIQPQSAFVILDHNTGQIKAIIGGRDAYGKNIYNRALKPQQPGSSIKPIGPYTVAIESKEFTAASVFDDVPSFLNDKSPETRWPYNWYENYTYKYRGRLNLRQGVEASVNVLAVKLAQAVGVDAVLDQLEELGISTLARVSNSNGLNDVNLSSVSLGGMTYGIKPIELAAAYSTYANQGVYIEPTSFTKITDLSGNIIVENIPEQRVVMDEKVAYIIQDLMISAVTTGVSNKANFDGMSVAGKTGTTSDKRDALFVGYTPYYTAAVWFGNDVKLKMNEGSVAAANFWSIVMSELHKDLEDIGFEEPEGIQRVSVDRVSGKRPGELSALDPDGSQVYRELFLPGTAPTETDDAHTTVEICLDQQAEGIHQLATPYCTNTASVVLRTRLELYDPNEVLDSRGNPILTRDYMLTVPYEECTLHNAEAITDDGKAAKVIQTIGPGQIIFIRDYNLLLNNDTFKFIPKDSSVLPDQTIILPDGEMIMKDEYNILYITKPETQTNEIYRRTQEGLEDDNNPPDPDGN